MQTLFYTVGYGGNASIKVHHNGSATLRMYNGYKTDTCKCKSLTSAKRTLSRWCDGFYKQVD